MAVPHSRVLHRSLRETPPKAVGGEGVWLFAEDGRKVLDASGGAAVSCLGHQHPRVIAAMAKQAETLAYAHTAFFSSEPAEELAEQLVGHEPGGLAYVYFVSGGSEAIEASIKIARQYFIEAGQPQRQHFIARRQSYHGNTLGALAAGGNAWRREPYQPLLSSAFSHVTPAFAYHEKRDDESEKDFVARLAAELDAEFHAARPRHGRGLHRRAGRRRDRRRGDRAGGLLPRGARDLQQAWRASDPRRGDVRHGPHRHAQCLGAGGHCPRHPGDREGARRRLSADRRDARDRRVVDTIRQGSGAFQHGHTYLAHPLACAAALEVQRIIADENLLDQVKERGRQLERRLTERFGNHRHVGDIRGRGLFQAIELVADRATRKPFDPGLKLNQKIKAAAFEGGLACYPGGRHRGRQARRPCVAGAALYFHA